MDPDNVGRTTRAALDHGPSVSIMIEVIRAATVTLVSLKRRPLFRQLLGEDALRIHVCESPWMPLDPDAHGTYPDGYAVDRGNVHAKIGCDSIINTTSVLADDRIMACCGLGMREIPELHVGHVAIDRIIELERRAKDDFLKRWIKSIGRINALLLRPTGDGDGHETVRMPKPGRWRSASQFPAQETTRIGAARRCKSSPGV